MKPDSYPLNTISRTELDQRIALLTTLAPHWVPIFRSVRDYGLKFVSILQGDRRRFWPVPQAHRRGPILAHLGDDMQTSDGPSAFNRASLRRLFRDCGFVVVVAGSARPEAYAAAGVLALIGDKPAAIIECTPERQNEWILFMRSCGRKDGEILFFGVTGQPPTACKNRIHLPLPELPESSPKLH